MCCQRAQTQLQQTWRKCTGKTAIFEHKCSTSSAKTAEKGQRSIPKTYLSALRMIASESGARRMNIATHMGQKGRKRDENTLKERRSQAGDACRHSGNAN
jgi:hypothetical protein